MCSWKRSLPNLPARKTPLFLAQDFRPTMRPSLRSQARTLRYRHNDMQHLERRLQQCATEGALIVSESVFSMEGDVADLKSVTEMAKLYGARTYVDEAHGIGIFGPTGAGVAEEQGV